MFRYLLFVAAVIGSAATAIAAISPDDVTLRKNVTVIEKNQFWHVIDDATVTPCATETCEENTAS